MWVFKSPFTTSIFPSTFEDLEASFTISNSFWLERIRNHCIVDYLICSVDIDSVSKFFVVVNSPPRFKDWETITNVTNFTCYLTSEFHFIVNRNLNWRFTIVREFIFVNSCIEEEWTWNVIFLLNKFSKCQDNLTSFCINFRLGNQVVFLWICNIRISNLKILRFDVNWRSNNYFRRISRFNVFSFQSKLCIKTESVPLTKASC